MPVSEEPRPEDLVAEAQADTLGEARWAAMKATRTPIVTSPSTAWMPP